MRFALLLGVASLAACASIQNAVSPPGIAKTAPEPATPLAIPRQSMKGAKGDADAPYPPDFAVTVKGDGTIVFPQRTVGKVKGSSVFVGGENVLTVSDDGAVKGVALKHLYKFDDDGALLDADGHGVRIDPGGGVRGVGGEWRYKDVLVWSPESGGKWDGAAWRTLEIVALVVIENMLPQAIRDAPGGAKDAKDAGAKDKGLTITIPPPSEWFK